MPPMPFSPDVQDLGMHAVALGVAQVHAQQLRREELGLVAAGAGPDLQDDVLLVGRDRAAAAGRAAGRPARPRASRGCGPRPGPGRASPRRPNPESRRASASSLRAASSSRQAATTGSIWDSSLPRRRSAAGSAEVSGFDQLGVEGVVLGGDLDELGVDHRCLGSAAALGAPLGADGSEAAPRGIESARAAGHRRRRCPRGSRCRRPRSALWSETIATSFMSGSAGEW